MSGWRNDPIKSTGFDAQIKHEDGFELHFYTDRLEAYRAVEKVCQEQIDRKPKTNADKIRQMTDKELVNIICCQDSRHGDECVNTPCAECLLDWLKQEVSDNG